MSKTEIILIRHGETEWNVAGRLQGQHDSPLTATGVAQTKALGRRMKHESFTRIYSSDLGRAFHTAQAIAKVTGHTVLPDVRLREKALGELEGFTWEEANTQYPEITAELDTRPHEYVIPGGESGNQMLERTLNFLNEIVAQHPEERIVAVTHGAVLSALLRYILQIPRGTARRFHILNTSIHEIAWENNQWWVNLLGDVRHVRVGLDEIE